MKIKVNQATKQGYIELEPGGVVDVSYPKSELRRGRVQGGGMISPTLTCGVENSLMRIDWSEKMENQQEINESSYRIRKLTPRECGRLMAVKDADISKMAEVNSNSQLYKQFGNSIVVAVLEAMFRNLNIDGVKTWDEVRGNYDPYAGEIFEIKE